DPTGAAGLAQWRGPGTIAVANKMDLEGSHSTALPDGAVPVSALTGDGIGVLLAGLAARIVELYRIETPLVTRARHRAAVERASASLHRAGCAVLPELRAEDLRLAWRNLGGITGRVDVEDLLDVIFAEFCLGK